MAIKRKIDTKPADSLGFDKIKESERPFSKVNFWMMGGCLVLIVLGYLFMSGGGGQNGEFNPDIFSTRRIVVGPLLSFLGFLLMAFAIIYSPAKRKARIARSKAVSETSDTEKTEISE